MPRPPDMLRFLGGTVGKHEVYWTGEWPPPEIMRIAHGTQTGMVTVIAEELDPSLEQQIQEAISIVITVYRRKSASRLPDDFESNYLFRGAEYVPVEGGEV